MPLYELELRYPDRAAEIRLADRDLAIGDTFDLDYLDWVVVEEATPENVRADARYICVLAQEQRARALKMQADDAAQRERIEMLRQRMKHLRERRHT